MSEDIAARPEVPGNVLVALKEAQTESGYLSEECLTELAESLGIPVNDVYAVASFYSFLSTRPLGRNIIRVWDTSGKEYFGQFGWQSILKIF